MVKFDDLYCRFFLVFILGLMFNNINIVDAQRRGSLKENFDDTFAELSGEMQLRFFDAVNGMPINEAQVTFEGKTKQTNTHGVVRFRRPKDLPPETNISLVFKKKGYIQSKIPVYFLLGAPLLNRFSISPRIPLGHMRIVLDWGIYPSDLDAHLIKKNDYHISYRDTRNHQDQASLDRDDRDGEGPETITILHVNEGVDYRFYVQDYTKSGNLAKSKATVKVYSSQKVIGSFCVPKDVTGHRWEVFSVINGVLE
jgi:uncharacterized protein YfaP (DUF2135 family)